MSVFASAFPSLLLQMFLEQLLWAKCTRFSRKKFPQPLVNDDMGPLKEG